MIVHLAGPLGLKNDRRYEAAYWQAFEEFFGPTNAPVVKAMLITRNQRVDTGTADVDRVCFGLRQTMSWLAEAIERKALANVGKGATRGRASGQPPPARGPSRPAPSGPKRKKSRATS